MYRSAVAFAPSQETVYLALASFASAHQNNGYGLEILERGLQVIPASAALHFHHGLLSALEGKRDQALGDFSKAAAANPEWPLPVLARGVLQLEDGQYAESAATFGLVLREHPDDPSAAYLRALALSRTGDAASRAEQIRLLETAVRPKPDDARALYAAWAHVRRSRSREGGNRVPEEGRRGRQAERQRALSALDGVAAGGTDCGSRAASCTVPGTASAN